MTFWDGHGGGKGREQAAVRHGNITGFLKRGSQISRCESRAWGTLYAARELAGKEDPICS